MTNPSEAHKLGIWLETLVGRLQDEVVSNRTRFGKLKRILPMYDMEVGINAFNILIGCHENVNFVVHV